MIRILVADDQALVRRGFASILDSTDGIEVVGEASNGAEAVAIALREHPDVVLMDVRMPHMDGLEATRRITDDPTLVDTRILILTTFDLDEYVHAALSNGANGFLLKDAGPALLLEAIRAADRGDALVSPQITVRLLRHFATANATAPADTATEPLTERERDVVRAAARGLTNTEIGTELYLSLSTVKTHLAAVQAKIGARNRVEVAAWAWRTGLMADAG
jgi:DNA-binding NarL/FixJ family response regulator